MTRRLSAWEMRKGAMARRDGALRREELRGATVPRSAPSGITSPAIKSDDPATRALIDEALARRAGQ